MGSCHAVHTLFRDTTRVVNLGTWHGHCMTRPHLLWCVVRDTSRLNIVSAVHTPCSYINLITPVMSRTGWCTVWQGPICCLIVRRQRVTSQSQQVICMTRSHFLWCVVRDTSRLYIISEGLYYMCDVTSWHAWHDSKSTSHLYHDSQTNRALTFTSCCTGATVKHDVARVKHDVVHTLRHRMRHVEQRDIKESPPKVDESCHNINESCPAIATRVMSWCAAATKSATRRATYNQRVKPQRQRVMSRHSHTGHVVLVRSCNSKCNTTCDIKSTSHVRVMSRHNWRVMSRHNWTSHVALVRSCNNKCDTSCNIKSTSHVAASTRRVPA